MLPLLKPTNGFRRFNRPQKADVVYLKFSNNQYVQEVDYNQYVLILRIHSHYKHLQTTIKTALWVL